MDCGIDWNLVINVWMFAVAVLSLMDQMNRK